MYKERKMLRLRRERERERDEWISTTGNETVT